MTLHDVALADRYDLGKRTVLLGGVQALVRATLMQRARDAAAGLSTAGYVTGYRGSPLGGVDLAMTGARKLLEAADVKFEPGLNEDLAATALWGAQQAALRGEGRVDGVFGLWYGKGPGVDRCGDVFRHANMAGSAALGGVLVCMGDDHTGESSTVLHHSEFALVDAMMPILSPSGVQEVLDYALLGWALSRYSGCWVGLKCVKDTIEVTEVVDGSPDRLTIATPTDFALPEGGLNIRLNDNPVAQEARLHDHKRFAAEAFARANRIDRRVHGDGGARIGIVSAGKSWLDTAHALELLGLDDAECRRLGITTWKVGMVWPLDMASFREWARDLEHIIVVEEKRKLIEVQIKEAIFDDRRGRRVTGWKNESTAPGSRNGAPRSPRRCERTTPRRSRAASPGSARAARTTPRPGFPRARGPMPGSAATTWCSGWTARPRASPTWGARARTGSARRRSRRAATCSRTSATAPTTTRACRRSAPRSRPGRRSPTRSCSTTRSR